MSRFQSQFKQKYNILIHPPPLLSPFPSYSLPSTNANFEKDSSPSPSSSSVSRISPLLFLIIVILAVIFFICGFLFLLSRFFMKRAPSTSILFHSNRFTDIATGSHSIQRQLQQLFRLHDCGLDQASIDALPVFHYKDIMGSKEPFDCAVCLCEFSDHEMLRLLPMCSHAFHMHCIDTWLLSNSTCPLCRGTLLSSGIPMQIPVFNFGHSRELSYGCSTSEGENGFSCGQKAVIMEESSGEKRVFNVRLGKFIRGLNDDVVENGDKSGQGESSSCNLDARRCYSMGSFQYVVGDSYLQVALSADTGGGADTKQFVKERGQNGNSSVNGDVEGKRISSRTRGESLSVSKIWMWSKKSKLPSYSDYRGAPALSGLNVDLPLTGRTPNV